VTNVSVTILAQGKKIPWCALNRRLNGLQNQFGPFGKRENAFAAAAN
jgi:hypothetical protein